MNPNKPNPISPFAPLGVVPAPDDASKLTVAADSVPTSIVPEAGYAKGKRTVDMYGQATDRPDDAYIAVTSADPNGRENPNAGDILHTLKAPFCETCGVAVPVESLANPATAHLGHGLSYKGKSSQDVQGLGATVYDVNGAAANQIGIDGGSYYLNATEGGKTGNSYGWQADVDRSTGVGVTGKRPVLGGGGDLPKSSRPYAGDVLGRVSNRPTDTDPGTPDKYVMAGPTSNRQFEEPGATEDTIADQIEDHTLEQM